ncbi:CKLF-like MARVEL transmembrane domain-containing protein 8 isoform X2 [Erinaceus europaeus]|uniref:CKLF-like MARVEL transmembrane domain-containing protein 8 isoform X2 n=1 Tax=Erinaceus europaeus TaxID=9365 RepID=A0ABM3WIT3_ERIEU|nr:CKLF-like MARVEL transmembrane domain-containing protein 8 isoform X2 [Erinaceus europaeus]
MEETQRARSHTVTTTASSFAENFSTSSSSFAYDREFLRTPPGLLIVAEIGLYFNSSAFILYLSAAIVDATSVFPEKESHNYNSWAASSFFAFLVTICYAGNTYFSFIAWKSRTIQ